MAACPHVFYSPHTPAWHPPLPDALSRQTVWRSFSMSFSHSLHFLLSLRVLFLRLFPSSHVLSPSSCPCYLLRIDHLSVTLCFSRPLSLRLNKLSMKTNVTPRTHDPYFPAKVNLPPCNKDISPLKSTERWRERERARWRERTVKRTDREWEWERETVSQQN